MKRARDGEAEAAGGGSASSASSSGGGGGLAALAALYQRRQAASDPQPEAPTEGPGQQQRRQPQQQQRAVDPLKVWVGGLGDRTDAASLEAAFRAHGEVTQAKVLYDGHGAERQPRGYGFVTFADEAGARQAMRAMDGGVVDGSQVQVNAVFKPAEAKAKQQQKKKKKAASKPPPRQQVVAASEPLAAATAAAVCRFHVLGCCANGATCRFSHDLSRVPCQFFFASDRVCALDASCPFAHDRAQVDGMEWERLVSAGHNLEAEPTPLHSHGESEGEQVVFVPEQHVGFVIGKGGATIRHIESRSGAMVHVVGADGDGGAGRRVKLGGMLHQIGAARDLIAALLQEVAGEELTTLPSSAAAGHDATTSVVAARLNDARDAAHDGIEFWW